MINKRLPSPHCVRDSFPLRVLTLSPPFNHSSQERTGLPGFYNVSLLACHGLWTPPDLHALTNTGASMLPSVCVKTLSIWIAPFEAVPALQGTRFPLRPTRFSVYAYLVLLFVSYLTPQQDQHSIRVVGWTFPDRDFHPARYAELSPAR